jgi:hypothetical protein
MAPPPDPAEQYLQRFRAVFHGPSPVPNARPLSPGKAELVGTAKKLVIVYNHHIVTTNPRNPISWITAYLITRSVQGILKDTNTLNGKLALALSQYVPVTALFNTASKWRREVMTPLSEAAGFLKTKIDLELPNLGWDDDARKVYSEDIVPNQRDASIAVMNNAKYLSDMLCEIGVANITYAIKMVEIVMAVVKQLIVVITEITSTVGSPFAIQDAAQLIAESVGSLVGLATNFVGSFADAVARFQRAQNEFFDFSNFPGGQWPRAVTRG